MVAFRGESQSEKKKVLWQLNTFIFNSIWIIGRAGMVSLNAGESGKESIS